MNITQINLMVICYDNKLII
ncbi:unnamed protein product [Spirodela intermedia]|uniref:Uncharacterized protein n=1 Tax=Spirodela intermedia TaxID=51605 RepID=A0A7I8LNV9_SPIIN|nr:unnamed protein product [Spirodela intermedia]